MKKKVLISESVVYKPLEESSSTTHFKQRLKNRLNSIDLPSKDIIRINSQLKQINRTRFPKDESFAIRLIRFNPDPNSSAYYEKNGRAYYKVVDERGRDSTGNELWIVIRNNNIVTFMLRKSIQTQNEERMKVKMDVTNVVY